VNRHLSPVPGGDSPPGSESAVDESPAGRAGSGNRRECLLLWALSLIAAARVLVFCAAFPFFNNVDEQAHFDMVLRYSHGQVPRAMAHYSHEAAASIALYGTPEYFFGPRDFAAGKIPLPLWMSPSAEASRQMAANTASCERRINHESTTWSLYYLAAGLWCWLGQACGVAGGFLLYWVRFLNVLLAAALVWLGYWAARVVFPGQRFPRLAVAALLAVYPQDSFYAIQSDVLSPVLFGLAFIGLVKLWRADVPGGWLCGLTGLALAGTVLVKSTNLPLLVVASLALLGKAWQLARAGKLYGSMPALGLLAVCLVVPLGAWLAWNLRTYGDATGAGEKIRYLTWTRKPWRDWWPHPLFSLYGEAQFWGELIASFWRGEFCWHGQRLASPLNDAFYCVSSIVLIGANLPSLLWARRDVAAVERVALWTALGSLAGGALLLALASMAFDFGNCPYPSRALPLFTSGRLLCGALIPFLLLYVRGLERLLGWCGHPRLVWFALAAIVLLIGASEIKIALPAFSSPYNLYHLASSAAHYQPF